jgi:hypothetical protein
MTPATHSYVINLHHANQIDKHTLRTLKENGKNRHSMREALLEVLANNESIEVDDGGVTLIAKRTGDQISVREVEY